MYSTLSIQISYGVLVRALERFALCFCVLHSHARLYVLKSIDVPSARHWLGDAV